ncbi:LysR family transcriptional regulator [uncultured Roseobacter sp.]|uniref:LysR family transcriptional regulator n=1 Tax=uncultured Roseobacter sp. TaxID=114847 RepID=UPI00344BB1E4
MKCLLALQRKGTLSEAGRRCGVSETTVARRLKRLERALNVELFARNERGNFEPTDPARAILDHAEAVEFENAALREKLGQLAGRIEGTVRLSSVPMIIRHILVPNLEALWADHPNVTLELVPEPRNVDLTKREADLAVRFSRPAQGGLMTKAKKLSELEFDVFCAAKTSAGAEDDLGWIGYDDANITLPQARWTDALRRQSSGRSSVLKVEDIDTALEAVAHGLGRAVLPKAACKRDSRIRPATAQFRRQKMTREVWLLSHADLDSRQAIRAAKSWLTNLTWS